MKKLYLFVFFLSSLAIASESISHSINLDSYTVKEVRNNTAFTNNIAYRGGGAPAMPGYTVQLLLPADADMHSLKVSLKEKSEVLLHGEYNVSPLPYAVTKNTKNVEKIGKYNAIYNSNEYFPAHYLEKYLTGKIWSFKIVEVSISPFKYNPVYKSLKKVLNTELVITYEKCRKAGKFTVPPASTISYLKNNIGNFNELIKSYGLSNNVTGSTANTYCVITTNAIKDASTQLEAFGESKEKRGYTFKVATEDDWGGGSGDAAAENIREWLQENYETLSIEYVLLLGNPNNTTGNVPTKLMYPRLSASDDPKQGRTDFYYCELTGDWDINGDGKYGACVWIESEQFNNDLTDYGKTGGAEKYGEVSVGRIPVWGSDVTDLDNILEKSIEYENTPEADIGWRKNTLYATDACDNDTPGTLFCEAITSTITPTDWSYFRIYGNPGSTNPDIGEISYDIVKDNWNSKQFGTATIFSHGDWQHCQYIIRNSDAAEYSSEYPSHVVIGSCENSSPLHEDNLSYEMLKTIGMTILSTNEFSFYVPGQAGQWETWASSQSIIYQYSNKLMNTEKSCGTGMKEMKSECDIIEAYPSCDMWWYNVLGYGLYGDPHLSPHSSDAQTSISVSDQKVSNTLGLSLKNKTLFVNLNNTNSKRDIKVAIYNIAGKCIDHKAYKYSAVSNTGIGIGRDTKDVAHGIYLIKVAVDGMNQYVKFVK